MSPIEQHNKNVRAYLSIKHQEQNNRAAALMVAIQLMNHESYQGDRTDAVLHQMADSQLAYIVGEDAK